MPKSIFFDASKRIGYSVLETFLTVFWVGFFFFFCAIFISMTFEYLLLSTFWQCLSVIFLPQVFTKLLLIAVSNDAIQELFLLSALNLGLVGILSSACNRLFKLDLGVSCFNLKYFLD